MRHKKKSFNNYDVKLEREPYNQGFWSKKENKKYLYKI